MSPTQSGCALYPAHLVIPLRITNRQRTETLIEQYSIEVETSSGFWQKLRKLDERTESFFFIGNDIHAASQIDLTDDGLDFLLWKKVLKPNEPIQGWALFEGTGPTLANKRLRITIVDNQENDYEQEQPASRRPLDPKETIQGNTLRPIPGPKDLSSCKIMLLEPLR